MVKNDHIYFQSKEGPRSGRVLSVGKHGGTVESDGKHHKVKHEHVLGVKKAAEHRFNIVDKGEDGAVIEDEDGKRSFMAGEIPDAEGYLDKFTQVDPVHDGDLVTRKIEREMHGTKAYQVIDGKMPEGSVYVGESSKRAARLLGYLDSANIAVPYEVVSRTIVTGDDEDHGVLFAFNPDEDQLPDLVNAVAKFQRKTALDNEDIMVVGKKVNGMAETYISTARLSGKTIMVLGERDGFESKPAFVSSDLEHMMKATAFEKTTILFMKGGSLKNKPGLSLQDVTDKTGHVVKKWKRNGQEEKTERKGKGGVPLEREKKGSSEGYGIPRVKVGDKVSFKIGDASGDGVIDAAGKDGATVKDADGGEHKVLWNEITGHKATPGDAGAKKARIDSSEPMKVIGEQKAMPPDKFSASEYFNQHNDGDVTADSIMAGFPPEIKQDIEDAKERLKSIEETIYTHKKDRKYVKEREKLHQKIISNIFTPEKIKNAKPPDGEKPTAVFLGGRGGSGKSAFTTPEDKGGIGMFDPSKFITLDADEIKQQLPEYMGWNAHQVHEESSDIVDIVKDIAKGYGLNIIIDATLKTTHKAVASVNEFKNEGYSVEVHYMHLPRHEAAKRAVSRFANGKSEKEKRMVPVDVVLGNKSNEASFDAVKGLADKWSFRDNNVEHGKKPILISQSHEDSKLQKSTGENAILFMRRVNS